jgi:hypothetical protein
MHALLASLIFIAASEVVPPAPPSMPDVEVVHYLQPNEIVEWNNAKRISASGESRVKTGQSILATVGGTVAAAGPKVGGLSETTEQVKVRSQKIIDEGNAQIQQALPSLTRLRAAATARAAELVKPVDFTEELTLKPWEAAVAQATASLQKKARDMGFAQTHLIGGIAVLGDRNLSRPPMLSQDVRAAWTKLDERSLAPVPADGYAHIAGQPAPALAKSLKPATAPKQVGVLWVEFYALTSDGSFGVLFLRLADAYSMRIIGSASALTEFGPRAPRGVALNCSIILKDDRSFLPRLAQGSEWVLGFGRSSDPLGAALLAHLCVNQTKIGISAAPYLFIVAGGAPVAPESLRARWNVAQADTDGSYLAYAVSSQADALAAVDVGQLTLRVSAPASAKK